MTRTFSIYPAWFIITPVMQEETISKFYRACENKHDPRYEEERNVNHWPQTFWGDCLFSKSHMPLVLRFNNDLNAYSINQLLNGKVFALEPTKFKGNRYVITYIPVWN